MSPFHFFSGTGYLAWPLFTGIVFSLILFLLLDYAWRVVTIRLIWLAGSAAVIWIVGLVGIYSM